jgi:hypothetical protein
MQHNHAAVGQGGVSDMGLKAPGIVTFMLSVILTVTVLIVHFFGADVPLLKDTATHFYALLIAQLILVVGCIMRGL